MNAQPVAHAMNLQLALTLMDHISVNVVPATLGMDSIVKIITSVRVEHMGAVHWLLAVIRLDRIVVPVMMDTLEMDSRVKVCVLFAEIS